MRLLHITPTYLPATRYGGPIFSIHGLCRALAVRGHTVEVFTTSVDGPTNSAVPHDEPVMLDGVRVHYFASHVLRRLYWAPALARALRRDVGDADAVHLHSVFLWPTWAAARAAARSRTPYVLSPRGMLVHELIEARHRRLKTAWISLIERSNLEAASAVHLTSPNEAEALGKFGFRLKRVATVPNGLDDIVESPAEDPPPDIKALWGAQPLILFFGRLSWVKGLDRLLRAFARTGVGALAIVGTDFDGLAPHLRETAAELGVAHRVHLVPRTVSGPDKEAVFAAASAFILPSYSESFGNAALEAMQRGLPVIVTRAVGIGDIVEASGGGIVADDTVEGLAAAMQRLLTDADGCRSIGEAGRQHVAEHYRWAAIAPRMEALYESLLH
ncbi:MAG TPA: glycosyltransferase [Stellaceae bacterium]|jgi:glycosyltransferase involved in cell wall biosynthesis